MEPYELKEHDILSKLLPPLSGEDYERLAWDIYHRGIEQALIVTKDGIVVDGHQRLRIARELDIDVPVRFLSDDQDVIESGLMLNLARRHLSHEQKRELIFKLRELGWTQEKVADVIGISRRRVGQIENTSNGNISNACIPDLRYKITGEHRKQIIEIAKRKTEKEIAADFGISQQRVSQIIREETMSKPEPIPPPVGKYRTIVVDPPWPIGKIEREVRPRQNSRLDYPVMGIEEIKEFKVVREIMDDECHVYLWTTQRFLPIAFEIFEAWEVKYIQTLIWHKNVGFTPFGLYMNNVEFVLFGRKGSLPLLKVGKKVVFEGKVREHSRKPDEFYALIREVSPEPRIDIFSREKRDGFESWGNEVDRFETVGKR